MGHANKDGLSPLRVRISWGGQRYEHTITNAMCSSSWNSEKQCFVNNNKETSYANKLMTRINYRVDSLFQVSDVSNKLPTQDEVKIACGSLRMKSPNNMLLFSDVMQEFISTESIRAQWKPSTKKLIQSMLMNVYKYKPKLLLCDVNTNFINSFIQHLYESGKRNSSVKKNIDVIKWLLKWTNEHGMTQMKTTDINQKFRKLEQEPVYLTIEEINILANAKLPARLERVRDVFIFCCFTGLRYSDAASLKKDDVKDGRISIITKKTDDYLTIDLNNVAKNILKKYENYNNIYALPSCSNSKTNKYLKEIGKAVGMNSIVSRSYYIQSQRIEERKYKWELLSSHCARRTFVAQSLSLGISAEIVMMITGHSGLNAMRPYMAISEKSKMNAMTHLGKILTKKDGEN